MLVDLKLEKPYDGLLYLAEAARHLQMLQSHHHAELEVNLVLGGTIIYVVDGRRFTFTSRTMLWLFPQQEHQLVDQSPNAQFYVAVFKPSLIARSCHSTKYEELKRKTNGQEGVSSTILRPDAYEHVRLSMESLMQGSLDSDLLNREGGFGQASEFRFKHDDPDALNAGLHYLLLLCWRYQMAGKASHDAVALHPAVRRALKILSESDSEKDLGELAKSCGASKSYLSRLFHQQTGVALNRYRNSLRLKRFFDLYGQPDQKTLAEAVYAAGFGSYAQFYKIFVEAYGAGPRECLTPKPHTSDQATDRRKTLHLRL